MPIRMIERNHRSAPVIFCDHCDQRIEQATDGNYEWRGHHGAGDGGAVYFTHKRCSDAFRKANPEPRDRWSWMSMELQVFPLYLANNLAIEAEAAADLALDLAQLPG